MKRKLELTEYSTKDLVEAAALTASGLELKKVDRKGTVCYFIFNDKGACEKASNAYFFGNLRVNARSYYENMNKLKNIIFR